MILSCHSLSKAFNEKCILQDVSFTIEEHDKAAIVGINGAGKTTLLKLIVGELAADEGSVIFAKDRTFGYLAQHQSVDSANTVYGELLTVKKELFALEERIRAAELRMKSVTGKALTDLMDSYADMVHRYEQEGGYACRSELVGVLKGLGFAEEDFDKPVATLSGGQKTRVALGKLLLLQPDLILLDEPTNHLDMSSITWLETYLLNYKGAVIIVSHDRYFLDRITGKIIEIDRTKATVFTGNYSAYAKKKEILRVSAYKAWMNQQQEIKHQEEVITKLKSFNREKSVKRAESREKMLKKIEVLDKPTEARADMNIKLEPKYPSGGDVLHVEGLSMSFERLTLFTDLSFDLKRGEHVAVIGDNGTGKTTILKLINGLCAPDAGSIRLGTGVQIGYYDQEHQVLHMEKTLFEEISDDYPYLNNTQIRSTLAAFLFTGDDVFKRIGDLSGGERGRVSLARLMLSESNFLILDEPTNHLDITSKEILEDALNRYTGTVLYVSHDRYFINRTASRILELSGGALTGFMGNYDYYLEKKQEAAASFPAQASAKAAAGRGSGSAGADAADRAGKASGTDGRAGEASGTDGRTGEASGTDGRAGEARGRLTASLTAGTSPASSVGPDRPDRSDGPASSKLSWQEQKEQQARLRKRENELKRLEDRIETLETRDAAIDEQMALPEICTDVAKLQELSMEKASVAEELEKLMEHWEELQTEGT